MIILLQREIVLIGIVSDTHDDMAQIAKAVEAFNTHSVSHVLHAGDLVSPFTFEILNNLKCPFTGIYGNNDGDRLLLREKSQNSINIQPHIVSLHGKLGVIVHEPTAVEALSSCGLYDFVIYGHTHKPEVRFAGKTLIINPGKAARLHKGESTAALLDLNTMQARIIGL